MSRLSIEEAFHKMMAARKSSRKQEEIMADLKEELKSVKEYSLLVHTMRLIIELDNRKTSRLYDNICSPMKQAMYLIDVCYSVTGRTETEELTDSKWGKISCLLDEMEMAYFISIGFPNNGDLFHDEKDEKIGVSLSSFLNYFSSAKLCYIEQTRDRIIRDCKPFDDVIQGKYGFSVDEAIRFILHIRDLNNSKYTDTVLKSYYYALHPEEWEKLTTDFERRGIEPEEWALQPELEGLMETLTTNPGEIFVHSCKDVMDVDIEAERLQNIIRFFRYDRQKPLDAEMIYYADKHFSEDYPLFEVDGQYVCPIEKFFFEALYNRLNTELQDSLPTKYKQAKDAAFEKRILEMFRSFFPEKTRFFTSYTVDGHSENDLLIQCGHNWLVVEIKDCSFRAPFRDPIKAYERIRSDFSKAIQYGYDQCKRVEDILLAGNDVDVYDAKKNNRLLHHIRSKDIEDVWTVIVTDYKYGLIQTDLSRLLHKEENDLYPWAVCADDLEVLLLMMRKKLKGIAPHRFFEYLETREYFHGHLVCFDELELAGWYLCDREQFKKASEADSVVMTGQEMGEIFDAYYQTGLGFQDELDIDSKRHYPSKNYQKSFQIEEHDARKFHTGSDIAVH